MDFFRKVKNYVTGQTDEVQDPGTSASTSATTGPSSSLHKETAVAYRPPPVVQNAGFGTAGGVQGLDWYKDKLKQDRDGDVADEFLLERTGQGSTNAKGLLHAQKRHLKPPKDPTMLVADGNVYVVPT